MRAWDWVEAGLYPSEDDLIRDALRCLLRNRPDLRAGRHHAGIIVSDPLQVGIILRRLLRLLAACAAAEMRDRLEYLSRWR